ncbi:ComEA family DNA-binding protein [Amycolatopsis alkalitolerans]|uniref:ComEA family DNA-binding protein n=1 Tax=Amycolatopsis alkalitolerans TaxID=2547244 RepID=A0A5C4LXS4_9PSEU|nr:ComEA family DNA-binding protein [Amycolatopsis alkalitolerans]TNC24401.1 ComEA family DNA-binding protein [Amycolatopsis alkalitolerans]
MFEQKFPQPPVLQARERLRQLADQALAAGREPPLAGRLVERWVPPALTRSPARRRLTVVLAVFAVVAVLVGGSVLLLGGGPPKEHAPLLPAAREKPAAPSKAASSSLVVSVVGKVRSPGLVTIPAGARVADALGAAGGALDGTDLTTLNLARKLSDGEQLYVGVPAPPQAVPQQAGGAAAPGKVNLNTASAEQLDSLPGVGEVTAKRIIDWRTEHGSFSSIDQLQEVDGIGAAKFARLRDEVTV